MATAPTIQSTPTSATTHSPLAPLAPCQQVRSILLTSGTLSPLDSFAGELGLDFPVRLENPHVISSEQAGAAASPRACEA